MPQPPGQKRKEDSEMRDLVKSLEGPPAKAGNNAKKKMPSEKKKNQKKNGKGIVASLMDKNYLVQEFDRLSNAGHTGVETYMLKQPQYQKIQGFPGHRVNNVLLFFDVLNHNI